ncbi:potassium transporter Kup [Pseudodesulfovibrio sp.]|uniref:potassium transporter Kup n=1 Tax=Pseudodesulfovibrio sp. TaxID=2035812 RepID=UPI00262E963B|nr:potassium transporter Kup [Pseudodesulfovibrio sp.]MDD3311955.1 potassium transporter Kup [Pseudodesulfovibrio sp.]
METVAENPSGKRLAALSLAALGVVFGDIGTSPLYALRECFHGEYAIAVTPDNVLGVLSLIFWALLLIVTVKYLLFILRADNHGEGGVIALTALVRPMRVVKGTVAWLLVGLGLFASCLLYGDGMITPAISVMSAIEGLDLIAPACQPYVVHITLAILIGLFLIQKHGTAMVGALFGPIILLWLGCLAVLGFIQVASHPAVLVAVSPWHGLSFLLRNHLHGFVVLGAVFLVVTGAEAIYADMGHFGRRPIRLTWFVVALPSLVLNYFGQGANLLHHPADAYHPFYAIVPRWGLAPMVGLATMATIIASQAVITGAFSLTSQAIRLGYLPRLRVTHTSAQHRGQIYVAPVNWLLMLCTIGLVLGFQSSSRLAAAYGVAVTTTMLITSILYFKVLRTLRHWSLYAAASLTALFLVVDVSFLSANLTKIFHGAWFPLVVGLFFFLVMVTWKQGSDILAARMRALTMDVEDFLGRVPEENPARIPGQAFFLTRSRDIVPVAMLQNLRHNKILHTKVYLLHIRTEEIPRVPNFDKIEVEKIGLGISRIIVHYGFMEEPDIRTIFSLCRGQGLDVDLDQASFFLGREKLTVGEHPAMSRWRAVLFQFLSRNAMDAASFFNIPSDRVIEVGARLEL